MSFQKDIFCQFLCSKIYDKWWHCFNIFCNFCFFRKFWQISSGSRSLSSSFHCGLSSEFQCNELWKDQSVWSCRCHYEGLKVHYCGGSEYRNKEWSCSEWALVLFGGENWAEIVRINTGIATTPLFRIDIQTMC